MGRHVVAGGAGFVGAHLCRRLLADGHDVVAVDDLSTGARALVADLMDHSRFTLVEQDVSTWQGGHADAFWHLACPAAPSAYSARLGHTVDACTRGTRRLVDAAIAADAPLFYASSSEVYGDAGTMALHEDAPLRWQEGTARGTYAKSKLRGEAIIRDAVQARDLQARVARLFNVYGPRWAAHDDRAVPAMVGAAIEGRPVPVGGDGMQTRAFCFIDDMVEGMLARMAWDDPRPVNLGRDEETTLGALAQEISDAVGVPLRTRRIPRLPGDPSRRRPDVALAVSALGWRADTCLQAGLGHTVAGLEALA